MCLIGDGDRSVFIIFFYVSLQVSFGVFETEECAGRQYDRALILEKGRSGKQITHSVY